MGRFRGAWLGLAVLLSRDAASAAAPARVTTGFVSAAVRSLPPVEFSFSERGRRFVVAVVVAID